MYKCGVAVVLYAIEFFIIVAISLLFILVAFTSVVASTVPPKIVPFPLGDEPSQMNQYITLSCTLSDGDLPLNIYWTFNGQPITLEEFDIIISKLGKRSSVLTIENVQAHHAGNYSCHGENLAGSTYYSAELKVIGWLCVLWQYDDNESLSAFSF